MRSRAMARVRSRTWRSSSRRPNASCMLVIIAPLDGRSKHRHDAVSAPGLFIDHKEGNAMSALKTRKRLVATLTVVVVLLTIGFYAIAQQPYQLTPLDEAKRDRAVAVAGA